MDSRHLIRVSEMLVHQVELVEERLHNNPTITREANADLFRELEKAQEDLKGLREKITLVNVFSQIQITTILDGLEDKIITLYGRLDNQWITSEVMKIEEEATQLGQLLKQPSNDKELKKQTELLNEHVTWICENHRLLRKDRKVIAFAREILKRASEPESGKKFLAVPLPALKEREENDDEALELFEIADLFYQQKTKMAGSQYNQLSTYAKNRTEAHLTDDNNIIHALLTAAFEISDSSDGSSITKSQIDALFGEAHQVRVEELWESNVVPATKISLKCGT